MKSQKLKKVSKYILLIFITLFVSCRHKGLTYHKNNRNENKVTNVSGSEIKTQETTINFKSNFDTIPEKSTTPQIANKNSFELAYLEIEKMLEGEQDLDFKRAVFVSENAFFENRLNYNEFKNLILILKVVGEQIFDNISIPNYPYADSIKLKKNYAIFKLFKDTVFLDSNNILTESIRYDFDDFLGLKNWSSTFVTKLLFTGTGNCHSLPYLYKILANELNTEAYLALAPNHIYIKHRNKRLGWYNTELTSYQFPTDAWVKASGYITLEAIRSGIYMDTLSQLQSVALCSYDLAKSYFEKTKNYSDGFVVKCCDLTLKYHPNNINAIILKAETLKKQYESLKNDKQKQDEAKKLFEQMQKLYFSGLTLGYREMPLEMYLGWLNSIKEEQKNFLNNEINSIFKQNTK